MSRVVSIQINPAQAAQLQRVLTPKEYLWAATSAVNDVTRGGVVEIKRGVRKRLLVRGKTVEQAVRHRVFKNEGDPRGVITISQRPVPLSQFRVRVSKRKGVVAQMQTGKPQQRFAHAFKGTVRAISKEGETFEHVGIFLRVKGRDKAGKLDAKGYARRLPIKQLYGPSVYRLFMEHDSATAFNEETQRALMERLARRMESKVTLVMERRSTQA